MFTHLSRQHSIISSDGDDDGLLSSSIIIILLISELVVAVDARLERGVEAGLDYIVLTDCSRIKLCS